MNFLLCFCHLGSNRFRQHGIDRNLIGAQEGNEMNRITLELAIRLIAIAEYKACQMGLPVSTAVVDECGNWIAFHRMDNATLAGIDIAENKAWTSATMRMRTVDLALLALRGGDAFGVNITNQGKVVILGGGIPLDDGGQIIGAIGVSGGTGAQDMQVAETAVQAFNRFIGQRVTVAPDAQQPVFYCGGNGLDKMTLDLAKQLIVASIQRSVQMELRCDIAIADEGGNLVAFYRMDDARAGDIEVSRNKAWSSVALQRPTAVIAQEALPGGDAFGINTTNHGRVVILGGGIPFISQNKVIGGVGVSGGTSAEDVEVADAAVQAFLYLINQAI